MGCRSLSRGKTSIQRRESVGDIRILTRVRKLLPQKGGPVWGVIALAEEARCPCHRGGGWADWVSEVKHREDFYAGGINGHKDLESEFGEKSMRME